MTSFTKNIVTDFSAPTDGTSDCSTAWGTFTAFLQGLSPGDDVTLAVPNSGAGGADRYVFKGVGATDIAPGILGGIALVINGTGVTFDGNTGGGFFLNANGVVEDNIHSARIASVAIGSTTVTLLTPSENTRFSINQYIAVTGVDLQGFGSPPNPAFCEYRKITAINAGSGVISFAAPLAQKYLSTWPLYNAGTGGTPDLGGPATIYAMPFKWDMDCTFNGLIFDQTAQPSFYKGRKSTFNNCSVVGTSNVIATANQSMIWNNFPQPTGVIEIDKMVESLDIIGGTYNQLEFQSMAATNTTVTNSSVTTYNGTPRNLTISGGSAGSLQIGAIANGNTDSVTSNNCVISAISVNPVLEQDILSKYTMSNGIISSQDSLNGPLRWAVPGAKVIFSGRYTFEGSPFIVTDLTQDGGFTRVHTTLTGGFPNLPLRGGLFLDLRVHPCPLWRGTGNTGCADAVDLSQSAAQGIPLWSYSKRSYTGNTAQTLVPVWGRLESAKINVIAAYTGPSSLNLNLDGPFVINRDGVAVIWNPTVNPKTTGERIVLDASVSGLQSGDNISAPGHGTYLLNNQITPKFNINISGESSASWPILTVEFITDQTTVDRVATDLSIGVASHKPPTIQVVNSVRGY